MPNSSARPPGLGAGASPVDGVSPTQSAIASPGSPRATATATASALAAGRYRSRSADVTRFRRHVGRTRDAAQREDPCPLVPRVDLAPRLWTNPHDGVRIELDALPIDLDLGGPPQHHEDLLLPGLGMVVLRILVEVRRQIQYLHPE